MKKLAILSILAVAIAISIGAAGCKKSDSPNGAGAAGDNSLTPLEREAENAAMAEVQRHWTKAADGWITARVSGSPYAPDHFLRQARDIAVDGVASDQLSEADRLNNVDWSGVVTFKQLPCREAGDAGMLLDGLGSVNANRQKGQWTPWADYQPERIRLQKSKGQWQINKDTWLLRGTIPTPEDYARAGVK